MSQEKVDKRKYEKKNRKQLEKKRKRKLIAAYCITIVVLGAIIGVPLGIHIYKAQPKYVGDSVLEAFVGNYIDEAHADDIKGLGTTEEATTEATTQDEVTKALEGAMDTELNQVDSDNVDEVLDTDSSTTESGQAD